ncbi:recombination regulator RecX [Methylophilus sp. VKM B-3414]|jgi:regulatory protein|uniref:recombination regulator RecX n=1 Tax=Methylophilus sp. VKM B-3414 TaxID=3076121 RepID=UPI0028CA5D79|nr:recombination regulator RecX [Methylophilus sp. VKM B-3414]MDT7849448.1 recombination regulator RecX [Methylophilus sp. VKM B-3414]
MANLEKTLRQRALEYLAKREYSYAELGQKLKAYAEEADDLPALLEDFKQRGWLSDARFTEQLVHARKAKFGSVRVANELREKGVDDTLIAEAVAGLQDNEVARASEVWRKKFKAAPTTREEWAKQARFLQSRGFTFDVIKHILNRHAEDDS